MRVHVYFCKANKEHFDICRGDRQEYCVMTTLMHPTLNPAADSPQTVDAVPAIMYLVTLTIKRHRVELLNAQKRFMQASLSTTAEP